MKTKKQTKQSKRAEAIADLMLADDVMRGSSYRSSDPIEVARQQEVASDMEMMADQEFPGKNCKAVSRLP